ncbi:hypothetical protein MMC14_009301 [Varicellaria rhodocarpa]|nr:hypothetical protein [Varicellaria rhodocarpa]
MTGGTLISEPSFSPAINAEFVGTGSDFIRADPSGKHIRLKAHGVVKDRSLGSLLFLNYTGVVDMTPELGMILSGHPDAKTTDFGNSFIEMRFETGDERLKDLETGTFVAAGRFIVEKEKPVVVEYRVSKVVKGGE